MLLNLIFRSSGQPTRKEILWDKDLLLLTFKDTIEDYEYYNDTKVEELPHTSIDLDNLPLSSCDELYTDIPNAWYDTGEELVLYKIE